MESEHTWQKIRKVGWTRNKGGCLEYNGFRNEHGYGQFRPGKYSKLVRVHRAAYFHLVGPITKDDVIMHICDNPACSEPTHLKKATQSENVKDMWAKGRANKSNMTECPNGHTYPPDRPKHVSKNRCRICANERSRHYRQRKKEALHGMAIS